MDYITALQHNIWQAPNGNYYLGEDTAGTPAQYLINLNVLLKFFADESDSIDLLIAAQRLIVAYIQEKHTKLEGATPEKVITESINKVAYFADVLDESICRDPMLIKAFTNRNTD